jgi:DNA processing protein
LPQDERSVTVVGTRKVTAYGREATATLSRELARNGVTVVSGLARGVDSVAHRGALEAGGRTIAVLGSGVDIIYPPEHRSLAEQILEQGALVSEHPLGVRPLAQYFPRRNRILSGMTPGTLVVEAGDHSGAHWTVQHALEQGREVFAVPGSIFSPASRGTNRLIQEGAKLVLTAQDILEELNLSVLGQQLPFFPPPQPEGDLEAQVLAQLSREPLHVDDLARQCGVPMADVNSALTLLELRGLIKEVGSRTFVRVREASATYETAG